MNDPKKDASAGEVANVFPERSDSDRSAGGHAETSVPPTSSRQAPPPQPCSQAQPQTYSDAQNPPQQYPCSQAQPQISYQPSAPAYTVVAPTRAARPKREFTAAESVFAWVCFILGYLFCRVLAGGFNPLGGFLFTVLIFSVTAAVIKIEKARPPFAAWVAAVSGVVLAASLIVTGNETVRFFAYLYSAAAYVYFVYAAFGNKLEKGFSNLLCLDFVKAAFICPFTSFANIFRSFGGKSRKNGSKAFLKVLAGIGIALIPCIVIISLLCYDERFREMLSFIKNINFGTVVSHLFSAAFGVPVAMYVYGLLTGSKDKKTEKTLTADDCRMLGEQTRIAPAVTVAAATFPIALIYVFFFISQWQYYVSAFSGKIPSGTSYSEYARNGFFELVAVSFINFVIIALVGLFIKRNGKGAEITRKTVSVVLSLMTLVLIGTAASKLVLYIDAYGLTPKRVYAAWAMLVLAVLFLLVTVKQFAKKLPLVTVSVLAVIVLFAGLAFSNTDSLIARYNVDRCLAGTLDCLDTEALTECGDCAVPPLVDFVADYDEKNGTKAADLNVENFPSDIGFGESNDERAQYIAAVRFLKEKAEEETGVFSETIPRYKARKALASIGLG